MDLALSLKALASNSHFFQSVFLSGPTVPYTLRLNLLLFPSVFLEDPLCLACQARPTTALFSQNSLIPLLS